MPLGLLTPAKPEYSFCSWCVLNSSSLSFLQSFSSRELDEEEDGEEDEEEYEQDERDQKEGNDYDTRSEASQ